MLPLNSRRKPDTTIVLVLSGQHAFWSRWQEGRLDAEFIELMEEPAASKQTTRCPWLSGAHVRLHLIVDSALDVVDRVVAPDLQRGFSGALQRFRLLRQLAREHTEADVIKLPGSASDIACLVRSLWPQHWVPWLVRLQSEGVVFDSIRSATQLWLALLTERTQNGLLVVAGARHHQHLWVEQGCIRFSRIITVDTSADSVELLDETLNHLVERLDAEVLDVYAAGIPAQELTGLSDYAVVRDVSVIPPASAPSSNRTASGAMIEELPTGVVTLARSLECSLVVPRLLAACVAERQVNHEPGRSRWHMLSVWARRVPTGLHKRTRRQRLRHPDARHLLKKRDQLNKLASLRRTTRIVVSVAGIIVFLAMSKGVTVYRLRADQLSNQLELRQQISRHREAALKLHSNPQGLNASLMRADYFFQVARPTPADVLSLVSLAVDQSSAVDLNRLFWAQVPETMLSAETESTGVDSAGFRQSLPDAMTRADTLRLQLAGHIDDGLPLRQRQQQLEVFVEQLKRQVTVSDVLVQVSPATRVAEGSRIEHTSPDFILQVLVRAG